MECKNCKSSISIREQNNALGQGCLEEEYNNINKGPEKVFVNLKYCQLVDIWMYLDLACLGVPDGFLMAFFVES